LNERIMKTTTPFFIVALALALIACAPAETAEQSPIITDTEQETIEAEQPQEPPMVGEPIGELERESETTTEPATPTTSGITRAELAQHNTARDCWVGYQGTVYDLTAWLREHPGGANAIAPYCGTVEEFTQAYQAQHRRPDNTRIANRGNEQGALAE